jgi:ParB family chromosome partitioning protein
MGRTTMTDDVREVLESTACTGNQAYLPQGLERKLYQQVADALGRGGGDWNRTAKAHVFPSEAKAAIDLLLSGEKLPDKNPLDFYATPPDVADTLVQALKIDWSREPSILEPSAGEGALVEALVRNNRSRKKWHLTVNEIDMVRHARLDRACIQNQIASVSSSAKDFLTIVFGAVPLFDYVVMNPPFTAEGDPQVYMTHIETALKLLKPGGRLAAIVPGGCVHSTSRRHQGFRALMTELGAEFRALPPKAFQASGTGAVCVMIVLEMSADSGRLVAEPATGKDRESMPTTELAPEHSARNVEQEVLLLPLDRIKPSKLNPRRDFDETQMQKLRDAIRFEGILTALTVRTTTGDTYEIVAGERRYRAASDLGLDVVPVVVRTVSDRQLVEMALSENMNREDLTPIDEAYAFSSLTSLGATQQEIAERIRKDVSYVSNTIRLLKLPVTFQGLITAGELTRAHGIALCGLVVAGLGKELGELVARTQRDSLTSRQVEQEVAEIKRRHEEARQPRLDAFAPPAATVPTVPVVSAPASSVAAQSELTSEGDVVFTGNTTSPSDEPPAASAAPLVEDRRSAVTAATPDTDTIPETDALKGAIWETNSAPTPPSSVVDTRSATATPPASATSTPSSAQPPPTTASTATASTLTAGMITCTIPTALDDWLWDAGFDNVTEALERMRLLGDAAKRQGKTLTAWIDQLIEEN